MICVLDLQHRGKPSSPSDRGAGVDLDGDRLVGVHEREADLTPVYLSAASYRLLDLGVAVVIESEGDYADRHARAVELARRTGRPLAYVACHLNAGSGDYGLVVHDHRSTAGRSLAELVREDLDELPELRRALVGSSAAYPRAHACLQGVYPGPGTCTAIVFEPCFVDQVEHRPLLTPSGLRRIGVALADGVAAWLLAVERS